MTTKTIYEASVVIQGKKYYGYSYEHPLFALNALSNKCIDIGKTLRLKAQTILSAKHNIKIVELIEDTNTNMLSFIPFSNRLHINGKFNELQRYLKRLALN